MYILIARARQRQLDRSYSWQGKQDEALWSTCYLYGEGETLLGKLLYWYMHLHHVGRSIYPIGETKTHLRSSSSLEGILFKGSGLYARQGLQRLPRSKDCYLGWSQLNIPSSIAHSDTW